MPKADAESSFAKQYLQRSVSIKVVWCKGRSKGRGGM